MNIDKLYSLVESLSHCHTPEEIEKVCLKFCQLCELEFFLFAVCNATSLSAPKIFTLTNYPSEWLDVYYKNNFQKSDAVVRYCFGNSVPITWNKLMKIDEYSEPNAVKVMNEAHSKGLIDGLSVPIKAPTGEIAILSLTTKIEPDVQQRLANVLPFVQYFGYSLLETHLKMNLGKSPSASLTPREKESLFWACEGKTAWEMSQIMSVAERTAIFHLSSATKKLGAANRQHAVAKAVMYGLIKPQP
ncbi:DNA-binding protein with HTH domain [Shewanella psychrophila]|uniref:DNA-binding protein with HTH domain n=1 Tax=Shewanella psychrophila TaxID=225848 RepID=A0A1S6HIU4_9GAMM|nr:LuxR family transcriptional regulator [Shewanella psychrophila]AQS35429.1 DNA-binding protein with HTH domain [Shewanella psychrophila]